MNQKDYSLGALRLRTKQLRKQLHRLLLLDENYALLFIVSKWEYVRKDLQKVVSRKRAIRAVYFNLNIFSTEECLRLFSFRQRDLSTVADVLAWSGKIERRRYTASNLTATCIVARRLSYPSRWFELEFLFGMSCQVISEIYWQILRECIPLYIKLFETLRSDLLNERARSFADCISQCGAPLPNCIGFMDGTKTFM